MPDRPIGLPEVHTLLRNLLEGEHRPGQESEYTDPESRAIIAAINAIGEQKRDLRQTFTAGLERSEDRLRRIIESTPVGICITNEDGYFEYVNPTYCRLYGYEESELIGEHFTMVVPEEGREELNRLHAEFMGRRYELRGEWAVMRKDGSRLAILADAAYIIDVDNRPKKVTFVLDITERKRSEELLRRTVEQLNSEIEQRTQLEKTKNEVERMIRHDLRNPLNGIMAAAEILMTDEISDEQRQLCVVIRESGGKLNSMLSSGMDLIRMEDGNYTLTPVTINLLEVIREVEREMGPLAGSGAVTIRLTVDGRTPGPDDRMPIEGERLYIADLLANIVRNAVEGSSRGDTVAVDVSSPDSDAEICSVTVHNTGVVPADIREIFFERYATSGKKNGTGLGTYVASLIARVHNGGITYHTAEGEGTTVTITLPRTQPKQSSD